MTDTCLCIGFFPILIKPYLPFGFLLKKLGLLFCLIFSWLSPSTSAVSFLLYPFRLSQTCPHRRGTSGWQDGLRGQVEAPRLLWVLPTPLSQAPEAAAVDRGFGASSCQCRGDR